MSALTRRLCLMLAGAALAMPEVPDPAVGQGRAPPPQPPPRLLRRLQLLASDFEGDAGVAVHDLQQGWTASVGGEATLPQQSVVKLWTALAAFDAIDAGRLRLEDEVRITRADLSVFRQPLSASVGPFGTSASIGELLALAISESDNAANDILVRRLGPEAIRAALRERRIEGISAGIEERVLQARIFGFEWRPGMIGPAFQSARERTPLATRIRAFEAYLDAPEDGASPRAVALALAALQRGYLLSPLSTARLLDLMERASPGPERLRAGLAPGWRLAHKTGTGPSLGPLHAATNDVGLMTAPDGRVYAVAAFVGRCRLPLAEREAFLRDVAAAVVDHWRTSVAGS